MKSHVLGNGTSQCLLCGEEFGLLGASASECELCSKVAMNKHTGMNVMRTTLLCGRPIRPHCGSVLCGLLTPKRRSVENQNWCEHFPGPGITSVPVFRSKGQR